MKVLYRWLDDTKFANLELCLALSYKKDFFFKLFSPHCFAAIMQLRSSSCCTNQSRQGKDKLPPILSVPSRRGQREALNTNVPSAARERSLNKENKPPFVSRLKKKRKQRKPLQEFKERLLIDDLTAKHHMEIRWGVFRLDHAISGAVTVCNHCQYVSVSWPDACFSQPLLFIQAGLSFQFFESIWARQAFPQASRLTSVALPGWTCSHHHS